MYCCAVKRSDSVTQGSSSWSLRSVSYARWCWVITWYHWCRGEAAVCTDCGLLHSLTAHTVVCSVTTAKFCYSHWLHDSASTVLMGTTYSVRNSKSKSANQSQNSLTAVDYIQEMNFPIPNLVQIHPWHIWHNVVWVLYRYVFLDSPISYTSGSG